MRTASSGYRTTLSLSLARSTTVPQFGEDVTLSRGARVFVRPPPGLCTVRAVQGCTVEKRLVIYEVRHPCADLQTGYTRRSVEQPASPTSESPMTSTAA